MLWYQLRLRGMPPLDAFMAARQELARGIECRLTGTVPAGQVMPSEESRSRAQHHSACGIDV